MSHRRIFGAAATALAAVVVTAGPLPAQARIGGAQIGEAQSRILVRADAVELSALTRESFAELEDGRKIVHEGQEVTAGELRAAAEAQRSVLVEMIGNAAAEAHRHLTARRSDTAANEAARRDAEITAAASALEELRARQSETRRLRRRGPRRIDG
jgi:hypothetical protein